MRTKNPDFIKSIEAFIGSYIDRYGTSPSVQDIADGTGMSKTNVHRYISYMRENGMLDWHSGSHRSIVAGARGAVCETVSVPVLGAVSCGIPKFAEENIEEYVKLPVSLFGSGDFYLLRAKGDSMTEAGIDDGDLVLIRQQSFAEEGQIAVALIDDEATLKRFYPEPEKHRVRLHPENRTMQDIFADDCIIQGVALKVLKNIL